MRGDDNKAVRTSGAWYNSGRTRPTRENREPGRFGMGREGNSRNGNALTTEHADFPWLANECLLRFLVFAEFFRKTGKATFANSA